MPPRAPRSPPASQLSLFEATRRLLTGEVAEHAIDLRGQPVVYVLKRAKRRTIGFTVGPNGLRVSAPRWTGVAEIEVALQVKAAWILAKLADQDQRRERREASKVEWKTGAVLPFLGEPLRLVLHDASPAGAGKSRLWMEPAMDGEPARLHVELSAKDAARDHALRDAVLGWLKRQALAVFLPRCDHFAQRLDVRYTAVRLSSAQTRWGSASSAGVVRLSWRLVHFPLETIDYVVAHELAHLREMNHSPRFWAVVESVVPRYRELRGTLQSDLLPMFD